MKYSHEYRLEENNVSMNIHRVINNEGQLKLIPINRSDPEPCTKSHCLRCVESRSSFFVSSNPLLSAI